MGVALGGRAADVAVTPLEETDSARYEVYLEIPEVSLMLPLDARHRIVEESASQSSVLFTLSQFQNNVFFMFFAIRRTGADQTPLDQLAGEELTDFLSSISLRPERLEATLVDDGFDRPVLSVDETYEMTTNHLVAVKGDWVLNMMIQRAEGEQALAPLPEEAFTVQHALLKHLLRMEGRFMRTSLYTIPDTSITLRTPHGVSMRVAQEALDQKHLMVIQPETQLCALNIYAEYALAWVDESVSTLSEEELLEVLRPYALGKIDPLTFLIKKDPLLQAPILLCKAAELGADNPSSFQLMIRDGWAVIIGFMPLETLDAAWALHAQTQIMRIAAGEEHSAWLTTGITRAYEEEGHIVVPGRSCLFSVRIPEGYTTEINDNTPARWSMSFFDGQGKAQAFHVTLSAAAGTEGFTLADLGEADALQYLGEAEVARMEQEGSPAHVTYVPDGPLGQASLWFTNEAQTAEEYLLLLDAYFIECVLVSPDEPISPALSETLRTLLTVRWFEE